MHIMDSWSWPGYNATVKGSDEKLESKIGVFIMVNHIKYQGPGYLDQMGRAGWHFSKEGRR